MKILKPYLVTMGKKIASVLKGYVIVRAIDIDSAMEKAQEVAKDQHVKVLGVQEVDEQTDKILHELRIA